MLLVPDIDAFEDRAALMEYEGGLSRLKAEDEAARVRGVRVASSYWQVLAD